MFATLVSNGEFKANFSMGKERNHEPKVQNAVIVESVGWQTASSAETNTRCGEAVGEAFDVGIEKTIERTLVNKVP